MGTRHEVPDLKITLEHIPARRSRLFRRRPSLLEAEVVDLSVSGTQVAVAQHPTLEVGAMFVLHFEDLHCEGRVMRVRDDGNGRAMVGFAFYDADPDFADQLWSRFDPEGSSELKDRWLSAH